MKSVILFGVLFPFVLTVQVLPAVAKPTSQTSYIFYSVSGGSLQELHRNMVRKGPSLKGNNAYGTITISPGTEMSVSSCKKCGNYHFDASFVIRLPKATNTDGLSKAENKLGRQFIQFVERHENIHRTIWMEYTAKFDQKLQASGFKDCKTSHTRAMILWKKMIMECNARQVAFDRQQRGTCDPIALSNLPPNNETG